MKGNGMMGRSVKSVALAMCAWVAATAGADAQSATLSSNAVQSSLNSSSGYSIGSDDSWEMQSIDDNSSDRLNAVGLTGTLPDGDDFSGSYVVTRFGARDGRIVAYGRLLPSSQSDLNAGETGLSISTGIIR